MRFFYTLAVRVYYFLVLLASLFNRKARLWIQGREDLLEHIALSLDHEAEHAWFHCASLGEFEQGRPVIERFHKDNPHLKIILTFFSPSGYEVRKNYAGADHVFYLPLDTPGIARKFLEYCQPRVAIFVKYEFWYNFMDALHAQKIPLIFISTQFRPSQHFFRFYGGWFRKQLHKVTYFFVQNKTSRELLYRIGIRNVVISGDTRFDRVYEIRNKPQSFPKVENFIQGSIVVMGGSTWPKDESVLAPVINMAPKGIKFIIAPHEIDTDKIRKFTAQLDKKVVRYSDQDTSGFAQADVLIIDCIGMLSHLYQYASLAYIGGGFGKGIHNILEAATFGMPIVFGPNFRKFTEARELIHHGAAFPVHNSDGVQEVLFNMLGNYERLKSTSQISQNYVTTHKGATESIMILINTLVNPGKLAVSDLNAISMN